MFRAKHAGGSHASTVAVSLRSRSLASLVHAAGLSPLTASSCGASAWCGLCRGRSLTSLCTRRATEPFATSSPGCTPSFAAVALIASQRCCLEPLLHLPPSHRRSGLLLRARALTSLDARNSSCSTPCAQPPIAFLSTPTSRRRRMCCRHVQQCNGRKRMLRVRSRTFRH